MLLNITQENNELVISKVNSSKKLELIKFEIPYSQKYEWVLESKNTIDGGKPSPLYTCWYNDLPVYRRFSNRLNKFRMYEFILNLNERDRNLIFDYNIPHKLYCDIETEVIDNFPDHLNPKEKITVVGCFDEGTRKMTVYGIKKLEKPSEETIRKNIPDYLKEHSQFLQDITFDYVYFEEEYSMLDYLFKKVFRHANVITGWNFVDFDWKYLVARARRLKIMPEVCTLNSYLNKKDNTPQHKLVVDYKDICKKWGKIEKEVENFKLETVSSYILNVGKIKNDLPLQRLYEEQYENYVYYNAVDTMLVYLLDCKRKWFLQMFSTAKSEMIETYKAFSPVHIEEILYCRKFYEKNKVLPLNFNPRESENAYLLKKYGSLVGGYVRDPVKGLFKSLVGNDFASQYPTTMRQFNMSPDSYIGMLDSFELDPNKTYHISEAGVVFDADVKSIGKTDIEDKYAKRRYIKDELMEETMNKIYKIKEEMSRRKIKV